MPGPDPFNMTVPIALGERSYDIAIGERLLADPRTWQGLPAASTAVIVSNPTVPPGLIDWELPLNPGDPIEADRVQGAEANVSLKLPQQGYPFIKLGQRDIVLDDATHTGDYTLPIELGPRAAGTS